MSFTVRSHCLDTAKHCALLHINAEHFHFMTVAVGVGDRYVCVCV